MDLNLDTLKREILDYLESREFAVFRSSPGTLDGSQMVLWDTEHYPDYQMFLDAASKVGVKLILFGSREFEASDINDLLEQLDDLEFEDDDERDYQARLRKLREYEGFTCSLELAFNHDSHLYVYEIQPDWYEEFLTIEDEIASIISEDELDEGDSLGGYFSKN
ncbi:MAG TPA: hypothetical protein VKE70_31955 [Candidatus Solibacter sp.]|nr:hypothetical protein [Candidatus Solibacter sp.]